MVGEVTVTTPPSPASREDNFPLQPKCWVAASSAATAWETTATNETARRKRVFMVKCILLLLGVASGNKCKNEMIEYESKWLAV